MLGTLADLARISCVMGNGAYHITAIKEGSKYRLFFMGEKLEDTRLLYCFDVTSKGDSLVYNPGSESEECVFKDIVPLVPEDYRKYKIPVVELSKNLYTIKNKLNEDVTLVRVKNISSLVKSVVSDTSGRTEAIRMYSFFYKGQHIVGTFSLFRDGASRTFAYAGTDEKAQSGYLRYDYLSDSVGFCQNTMDKAVIYIRLLNLAEPFPFFKEG
jgi:hypothetical protein